MVHGQKMEWEPKDVFCVPGWNYHEHEDYNPDLAFECWEKYDKGDNNER